MSIFVLSDLHLSTDSKTNKSMEVFGARWQDYTAKIEKNWNAVIGDKDTVIIPGDISWATKLEDSESDLRFINSLKGRKLIGKGNHDFWWSTAKKMNAFFSQKGFSTISILYNNAYIVEDRIICGTRGWFFDEKNAKLPNKADFAKLTARDPYELFAGGPLSLVTIENPNAATDRELIVFRDSFGSSMVPLLVQDYAKVTLVDIRYIQIDVLDRFLEFNGQDILFLYSTLVLNNSETIK